MQSAPSSAAPSAPLPVVIILASGRGERFAASGGSVHKLAAMLAGKPVLAHAIDAARASGLPIHIEAASHPGMGDSIAAAVRATREAAGWLILPGDLPLVLPDTLQTIARALENHDVVQPWVAGQRGHPVGFSRRCAGDLMALSGDEGARSVVQRFGPHRLDLDDEGCITDVDTVQALTQAEASLAGRAR
ncbi:MAG: nucleotidyltransferase family protein [Burkholderiales bacterium]